MLSHHEIANLCHMFEVEIKIDLPVKMLCPNDNELKLDFCFF